MKIYGKNVVSSNQIYDGTTDYFTPSDTITSNNGTYSLTSLVDYDHSTITQARCAVVKFDVEQFLTNGLFLWCDTTNILGYYIATNPNPTSFDSTFNAYKNDGIGSYTKVNITQRGPWPVISTTAIENLLAGHTEAYLFVFIAYSYVNRYIWSIPSNLKAAYSSTEPNDSYATTFTNGWFKTDYSKGINVDDVVLMNGMGQEKIFLTPGNWYNREQANRPMRITTTDGGRVDYDTSNGVYSAVFQIPTDVAGKTFSILIPQCDGFDNYITELKCIIVPASGTNTPMNSGNYFFGELFTKNAMLGDFMLNGSVGYTFTATNDIAGKWAVIQAAGFYQGQIVNYNQYYTNYIKGSSDNDCMRVAIAQSDLSTTKPYIVANPGWNLVS